MPRLCSSLLLSLLLGSALVQGVASSAQATGIYWTDPARQASIGHANLDGTGVNNKFIYPVFDPQGIAVDGSYLYWTYSGCCSSYDSHYIARANLDSSAVNNYFINSQAYPSSIAVDGAHIYWGDNFTLGSHPTSIGRANIDGTGANNTFIAGVDPASIAVDGNYIYWSDYNANTIGRANLDGTGMNSSFITGAINPRGIAVDGAHIYWANNTLNTSSGSIGRANVDGTGVNQSFLSSSIYGQISNPVGVAVDGTYLYFTTPQSNDYIWRANLDGTNAASPLTSTNGYPFMLAVSAIPEPGTGLLVIAGLLGLAGRPSLPSSRPRRKKVSA